MPKDQLETILDNLGVPNSGINLSYSNAGTIGTLDGEILLSLKEGPPADRGVREPSCARELPKRFPGIEFFFQPADIVTQILNFGLPAAIDVQFTGNDLDGQRRRSPPSCVKRIRQIPGAVDAHVHQRLDAPAVNLQMDRTRLQQMGLSAQNVGQNVLVSLSGSSQTAPAFWLNPQNGVVYYDRRADAAVPRRLARRAAQRAGRRRHAAPTAAARRSCSATSSRRRRRASRRSSRATTSCRRSTSTSASRAPTSRASRRACRRSSTRSRPKLPRGSQVVLRGQVQTMQASFIGLGVGLAMAIVLVYLLIVVNFQSWIDALIIVAALPAALAGIAWMLFITGTTLSVPALTGAIMTMGVATANSILLVSFARQRQQEGAAPRAAARDAGATRIRPVLMTALAMIIGMIPMALGIGEGAEQNAPLGRAVIGGLLFATVSTLLFVPVVFAGVHERLARRRARTRRARRGARRRAAGGLSDERDRVPAAAGPARSTPTERAPRRARARASPPSSSCVLLAVGAGRTMLGRMANATILEASVSRARGAVREDDGRQHAATAARRLALPGTLQGFAAGAARGARQPAT